MPTDGRHTSRFRPPWEPDRTPRITGLCVTCLRAMWTNTPTRNAEHLLVAAPDGWHCEPCARYIRDTGADPRDRRGNAAERLPQEAHEDNQRWRDPGLTRCTGAYPEPFWPDPLPEELETIPDADRREVEQTRRYVAAFVCGPCPVAAECRQDARSHGYEGLWGGRFFERTSWVDPLTELRGPTMYTRGKTRDRMIAALARAGYDEDGEPVNDAVSA